MAERDIIDSIRRYILAVESAGIPVSFVVLFGSHARGNTHQWSDIDLMVVSPRFDETRDWDDKTLLWRTAARTDSRIEPLACGLKQWTDDTSTAIVEIARREGRKILPHRTQEPKLRQSVAPPTAKARD